MKFIIAVLAIALTVSSVYAQKKHKAKITEKQATKTALEQVPGGTIESAELEKEGGKLIWSFDVKTDSVMKEVWVDATTGKFIKTETESASKEQDEAAMDKAEKIALKKIPGEIVKQEMTNKKGKQVCSFEIKTKKGKMVEVEVDAKTNKIVAVEEEESKKDEDNDGDDDDQ